MQGAVPDPIGATDVRCWTRCDLIHDASRMICIGGGQVWPNGRRSTRDRLNLCDSLRMRPGFPQRTEAPTAIEHRALFALSAALTASIVAYPDFPPDVPRVRYVFIGRAILAF